MANTVTISGLRQELWRKQLFADVRDLIYMNRFVGNTSAAIIQELTDLKANKGFRINFGLGMKLSGTGVTGDAELEGQEESMDTYAETISIDQIRNAVRLTGRMDEKQAAYDMRMEARTKLATWIAEFIEQDFLDKLCGKASATFANTPTVAAVTRSIYAGGAGNIAAITTAMKMDTKVLDAAKQMAILAQPRIRPANVGGKQVYVVILHPYDATNLRQDPVWNQAQREANIRGEKNPIFSGALGIYNGMVIHEHQYVYRTNDGSASAYVSRNLLLGQQSSVIAYGKPINWVEKSFDYGNKWGISCGAIYGTLKPIFNAVDYGVITMHAASAAASTA